MSMTGSPVMLILCFPFLLQKRVPRNDPGIIRKRFMQHSIWLANKWQCAIAAATLLLAGQVMAAPTSLLCTFDKNVKAANVPGFMTR
jgi:hypothetical protein